MERDKLIRTVTAAQKGDGEALNTLFNEFYNDVYYFSLKTVKDSDLACDITQETFVEIINTLDQLQEPAAFVTWMKQITYHQCTRYFKKKKDVLVDEDEEGNTIFDTLTEEKTEFIPDEALDQQDFRKTILDMIDQLSEEQRAAIMMYYFDELSVKQIAEIQGCSEGTVKSRLNYARKSIKASVEDYEKKNGVKLHCVGVLPLLLWLWNASREAMPAAAAGTVAQGVTAATGTAVAVSAGTTTAATVATGAAVGTGAAAGTGVSSTFTSHVAAATNQASGAAAKVIPDVVSATAKKAAKSSMQKIVSGLAAGAIAIGGFSAGQSISLKNEIEELNKEIASLQENVESIRNEVTILATAPVVPEPAPSIPVTQPTETTPPTEAETTSPTEPSVTVFYVPAGCTYITKNGEELSEGEAMPEAPSYGDTYKTKDYTYCYGQHFRNVNGTMYWQGSSNAGWGVRTNDQKQTSYEPLSAVINGAPLTNLDYAFDDCIYLEHAPEIPEGVIGMDAAFRSCAVLKTAPKVPVGVVSLWQTFYACTSLTDVPELPEGLQYMQLTFAYCVSLESVPNIPEGVFDISGIFKGCKILKEAPKLPSTLKVMDSAFYDCSSLMLPPEIPYGVYDIEFVFYNCYALTQKPEIPDSVTESMYAFYNCISLPE